MVPIPTLSEHRAKYVLLGEMMTNPLDTEYEADGLLRSAAGAPADDESQLMRVYATDPMDPDSSDELVSEEDVWRRK